MTKFSLTAEQVQHYKSQGYLILRANEHKLATSDEIKKWVSEVRSWPNQKGKWMPYLERNTRGELQLMRTEKFADYHAQLSALLHGAELRGVLQQLSGDNMLLFKDKINYKAPFGNGFQAHLDAPAYDHMGKIEHITANIAVDSATPENGCLEVVPGSQHMSITFIQGGHITNEWEQAHEWVSVPLEPADILIFGSHLAHRSLDNKTDKARAAIYATYHAESDGAELRENYYAHRREQFPPDHERVAGRDYTAGWQRYGFAAPFARDEPFTSA